MRYRTPLLTDVFWKEWTSIVLLCVYANVIRTAPEPVLKTVGTVMNRMGIDTSLWRYGMAVSERMPMIWDGHMFLNIFHGFICG